MDSVFQQKIKTSRQIKTKDQNLKKKYYNKMATRTDLLKLSHEKISDFVAKTRKMIDSSNSQGSGSIKRLQRLEKLLVRC